MELLKSIIIRQDGKKIIHIKVKPYGVDSIILKNAGKFEIICITEKGERIKIR